MKKRYPILLAVIMMFALSIAGSASAEVGTTTIDGRVFPVYDYSSFAIEVSPDTGRTYSETEQAKIDAALEQAMLDMMLDETVQPGENRLVGTLNGKPLYARTEVSTQITRDTKTKNSSKIFTYDFGWGAGYEEICKATAKGTFNISGGKASVVRVEGTYSILDDRCSAEWNDDLRINSSSICQIGFDLYYDRYYVPVTQAAFVDGEDGCYVQIRN